MKIVPLIGLALACTAADAAIISVTGNIAHIATPTGFLDPINNFDPMRAWDELQNVSVSNLSAEATNNPCDTRPSGPTPAPGIVSGTFDSHMILASDFTFYTGSIRFSGQIAAVIVDPGSILASDPSFAPPGLIIYGQNGTVPSLQDMVGGGGAPGGTGDWIRVDGDTLTLNELFGHPFSWGQGDMVEIRVLTYVPAPGVPMMLGAVSVCLARRRRR